MGYIINLEELVEAQQKNKEKANFVPEQTESEQVKQNQEEPKKKKKLEVPVWHKLNLTLEEAAAYSGIGINKLREISNARECDFVCFVGSKRLIKRRRFEDYLDKISAI